MKQTIPVIGMACASCSANIERKLNELDGINEASVSLPGRSALVDYDPEKISLEKMKSEINGIGYDLVIDKQTSVEEVEKRAYTLLKRKTLLSWVFWYCKYGYSCCFVNRNSLLVQYFQHLLGRCCMGEPWNRMAHLFRCFGDDYNLCAYWSAHGREG